MRSWAADAVASFVEALLDLVDAFAAVRPRVYVVTALLVLAVVVLL